MTRMTDAKTFISLKRVDFGQCHSTRIAVLGISGPSFHQNGLASYSAQAPRPVREASANLAPWLSRFYLDVRAMMPSTSGNNPGAVGYGDVPTSAFDSDGNRARIPRAVRASLDAGVMPETLGGDDSVPTSLLQAFKGYNSLSELTASRIAAEGCFASHAESA